MFGKIEHVYKSNKPSMERGKPYKDLIEDAVEALRKQVRMPVIPQIREYLGLDHAFDAVLDLEWGDRHTTYLVEAKPTINNGMIGQIANRFRRPQEQAMLVTQVVPTHLARKLQDLNIQFLDTVGNAHLNAPGIYVFIHGNKRTARETIKEKKGIFTPAGTKVIFTLLCRPDLKDATYREIAQAADVALETINRVFKGLQRQGYLIEQGTKGRRLENRTQLLERWVVAYAEQLRPKQLLGTYRARQEVDWEFMEKPDTEAMWGGETAAAKLTQYLKPAVTTIYTHRPVKDLVAKHRLVKDPQGDVEVRKIFWNFGIETPVTAIVPPLLVYADLMATADPRNIETAKLIYDEHLQRHLRGD